MGHPAVSALAAAFATAVGSPGGAGAVSEVPLPGTCPVGRECTVVGAHAAGRTPSGPLQVVEVALTTPADPDGGEPCPRTTWWRTGGGLPPVQLLAICNDGYGASGVGEDTIRVSDNTLSLSRYGGSAWRWSESFTVQLAPLAVLESSTGSFHAAAPDHESTHTADLRAGVWRSGWTHPECAGHAYLRVPVAPAVPAPDVPLGTCSARASADGSEGFVAFGRPSSARDGRLAVAMVGDSTLVIDVWDDIVVAEAGSWVHADHLEIWLGAQGPDQSMDWDCDASGGPAMQWAVDWAGRVHPGAGASGPAPTAVVTPMGGRHRVVVTLPGTTAPPALTVVFSDADPQGPTPRQERLVATSPVSLRAPHRLGSPVSLRSATCAVAATPEGPRLQLVSTLADELAAGGSVDGR